MKATTSSFVEDIDVASVLSSRPAPRRALFLDRDGVINVDRGYVHTAERTEWLSGIFELCRIAAERGLLLVVVTNQAGIARGLYGEAEFLAYTRWMHDEFREHGTPLLATYYCPHHPKAGLGPFLVRCSCRKPAPGMIVDAAERYGIILAESWLVGNRESDIAAGLAAGVGKLVFLQEAGEADAVENSVLRVDALEEISQLLTESMPLHI